ncbi:MULTISPECIES: pentapeptide repeat-containing protein [Actinosynnema]|uniref:pentapeptide repeat-containing protein n=1 Tax=Actinosynnema TaxID=40566 RepID=UPI0026463B0B|nr:pentapeptide repeat-containing protein [Actinosynnema pretiosum]MCP2097402.1 Uncharacterized protein YjbI, contains pentapeptide repeats [Actinosynnema pretiosum]
MGLSARGRAATTTWVATIARVATVGALGVAMVALYVFAIQEAPKFLIDEDVFGEVAAEHKLTAVHNARLAVISIGGALVVAVGLLYTARNYRLAHRGQVTDRFTKALERLGSDELYVRIGGIHALEHVMRDSPQHHGHVVKVLVAFIRERTPRRADETPTNERWMHPPIGTEPPELPDEPPADVQAALTALGQRPTRPRRERNQIDLSRLHLTKVNLANTNFGNVNLDGADLRKARLWDADLRRVDLLKADLRNAYLDGADLRNAYLWEVDLREASLQSTDLRGAVLTGADLRNALLSGADLREVSLWDADLRDARLAGADLRDAQLAGADLRKADLRWADLRDAHLSGDGPLEVHRQGADLRGAFLQDAKLDQGFSLPGSDSSEDSLGSGSKPPGEPFVEGREASEGVSGE